MRKKIGSKSQKVSEILRFDNFMGLRFRLDLTHENGHNSLNFEIEGSSFGFFLIFKCLKNHI